MEWQQQQQQSPFLVAGKSFSARWTAKKWRRAKVQKGSNPHWLGHHRSDDDGDCDATLTQTHAHSTRGELDTFLLLLLLLLVAVMIWVVNEFHLVSKLAISLSSKSFMNETSNGQSDDDSKWFCVWPVSDDNIDRTADFPPKKYKFWIFYC